MVDVVLREITIHLGDQYDAKKNLNLEQLARDAPRLQCRS